MLTFLSFSTTIAQEKTRGITSPGTIGKKDKPKSLSSSDILCKVTFQEPSGDPSLVRHVQAYVAISVKNIHKSQTIKPKLEMTLIPVGKNRPILKIQSMDPVAPGEIKVFRDYLSWTTGLVKGAVIYRVSILDTNSRKRSNPAEIRIHIPEKKIPGP